MIKQLRAQEAIETLGRAGDKQFALLHLEHEPHEPWPECIERRAGCCICQLRKLSVAIAMVAIVQAIEALKGSYDEDLLAEATGTTEC